jgi:RimJ/RimL family protein N-acetyltransferase
MQSASMINGKYVKLRSLVPDDAEMTLKWRLSERASLLNKGADSVEAQRKWIETRPNSELNYIIELNNGTAVGMLSLIQINHTNKNAEAARFLIGEEELAKGIPVAIESMMLLYQLAFETLGLERIYGTVLEENVPMLKWQLFFGMSQEGVMKKHYYINDKFQDAIMVGILKAEFFSKALPKMKLMLR